MLLYGLREVGFYNAEGKWVEINEGIDIPIRRVPFIFSKYY